MTDYFTGVAHRHGFPLAVPSRFDPTSTDIRCPAE